MKKNNFIDGAIISTLCLIICKILGLIYVIPFYKIIGTQGGALYSYAYSIYAVFLNLSTVGIPSAIAKIISEYDTLSYKYLKEEAYKIANKMLTGIGFLSFLIMFFASDIIANSIIGGVSGGNSVEAVSIAIKAVSLALLIVPKLSILKGYFQGNRYLKEGSISAIIEQLVRVLVIVIGSFVTVKVFKLSVECAVYVAVLGASIGALVSYFYLKKKAKPVFIENEVETISEDEKKISKKDIIIKIIVYAIPFVIISMLTSAYNVVDTFTVVKTLTRLGYETNVAETTIGVISTWGSKLNMIVVSISIGITSSLIPNVVGSYTKGNYKDINEKLNITFKMLLYLTIPMAFGMSILSKPIWHVFYGIDILSTDIFRIYILQVVVYGLFTTITTITQSMNQTKITIGALVGSFLLKLILNVPIMNLLKVINIPSFYGPIITDMISVGLSLIGTLLVLKKNFKFSYREIIYFLSKVLLGLIAMLTILLLLKEIYFDYSTKLLSILTIVIYTLVGALVYFFVTSRFKLLQSILGDDYIKKIKSKFRR